MKIKGKKYTYAVVLHLVRDPGVSDGDLARSLDDWKCMRDSGRSPPDWGREPDGTLNGFLRMLTRSGVSSPMNETTIVSREDGVVLDCVNVFDAPTSWMDVMAQALSFMAYGLRPCTYMNVSLASPDLSKPVTFRSFKVVLNGDGEPEVEEVGVDD